MAKTKCSAILYYYYEEPLVDVKQGITNTLALPIDKMLDIYLLCPHSEYQKIPFQSKHFHPKKLVHLMWNQI